MTCRQSGDRDISTGDETHFPQGTINSHCDIVVAGEYRGWGSRQGEQLARSGVSPVIHGITGAVRQPRAGTSFAKECALR